MNFYKFLDFKLVFMFCFSSLLFTQAQDYTKYYELIDSANFYKSVRDDAKVNEYYLRSMCSFRGFSEDYCSAILYNYIVNKKFNDTLIEKGFRDGLTYRDLKSTLTINKVHFYKKNLKRLYRKNKLKKTTSCFKLYRLLLRDQFSRRIKRGNIQKADQLTGKKLIKLQRNKPELFDRFQTGFLGSEILDILLMHSGWKNLREIQDSIHLLTKTGLINRKTFANIIEREAFSEGIIFEMDSSKSRILSIDNKKMLLCDLFYPNICFNYGRIYDKERKVTLLPPTHPYLTEEKINELRSYLFLSPISLLYSNHGYLKVSQEEYCKFKFNTFR